MTSLAEPWANVDLANLIASAPQLDWADLRHWVDRLGLLPLLEEARF